MSIAAGEANKAVNIKIGIAGIPHSAKGGSSIDGVKKVAELGLQAMEIEFVQGVRMSNESARELGKVASDLNIDLSAHAPYYINLASTDALKRKQSAKRILDTLERGNEMGAKIIAVHAGYYSGQAPEKTFEIIKAACVDVLDKAKEMGIKTMLGLESGGKLSAWGRTRELAEMHKQVKGCYPYLDFAHIFACNNGFIDYAKVLDKVEVAGIKHVYAHFSGINFTEKGERNHIPMEQGGPDFKSLVKELIKRKLPATIICESPELERDALRMKSTLKLIHFQQS